ncbi:LysE family transporter [Acinetobacter bereziniae]|uniref:LysE family transporter n=1 Tax=Acinetobacter bereziniae TaxID=106648 RepID=UPI0015808DC5|nr:LysE family transporter [Acinetobacter bereziniae]NUF64802.1 LysE family transporter [Acinetobacter bereziniae]NUG08548.1 LysE family transporter [Acinetobacter bereziniae]NUG62555.1 LysE family transporter [Acinetobacter bereziniae]NUG71015.1 LysE family transporter [Acinetobacter bereziniae]NUG81645.1 LysE family transporter [Acinetobacter bereziniae]
MSMLLTICALHFVAQLSPGPDVLLVAKSSASTTRANTLKIILGISAGVVVWVILTLLGFTVLLEHWPWIQQVLMLIGGFFLARMGYAMLKGGIATLKQSTNLDGVIEHAPKNYFLLGLFTNLANPKIVIYFSSVFSLALSSSAGLNLKPQLAVIIPIQTFLVFSLLMLIMSVPKIKAIYQRSGSYIDILSGSFFLLFAAFLWVDVLKMFY